MPAAGFAIDLLPGRGLERSVSPARDRAQPPHRVRHGRSRSGARSRLVRSAPARASWSASAGYASLPALVAARVRRDPGRRPRADAHPGPRQPHRGAPRRPGRGHPAGHALPGAVVTGNPIRPAIAAVAAGAGDAAAGRGRRRQPRRPARSTAPPSTSTTAGATAPTSRSTTSRAPATTKGAHDARGAAAPRATAVVFARPVRGAHGGRLRRGRRSSCPGPGG